MAVKKGASARKTNTSTKKQTTAKKTASKTAAKKPAAKKTTVKKAAVKKPGAIKVPAKKTSPKKAAKFVSAPEVTDSSFMESSASFLSGNACFYNRELSWLEFNNRILHEARDTKNPLLEKGMNDAKGLIIYLSANRSVSLEEVNEISDKIAEAAAPDANIIWGFDFDDTLGDMIKVSIIASNVK